jgi:hypothetical protein
MNKNKAKLCLYCHLAKQKNCGGFLLVLTF